MSTKGLSRKELVEQSFDICKQLVLSYGPETPLELDRTNICKVMEHYKQLALRAIESELNE